VPVTDDPFDLLGLHPRYDLDGAALQRSYLMRAAAVHPDLAGGEDADRSAAALNKAKLILENPEKRAEALLMRFGGPGKSDDKSLPAGFLMSIMETREAVEEALVSKDPAQRAQWEAWAQEQRGEYQRRVASLFAAVGNSREAATLRAIRHELNAWRYIERLIEQLDPDYDPARRDFAD
jgi:molecular chaperone HscB